MEVFQQYPFFALMLRPYAKYPAMLHITGSSGNYMNMVISGIPPRIIILLEVRFVLWSRKCEVMKIAASTLVMIPQQEWDTFREQQEEIVMMIKTLSQKSEHKIPVNYITAKEFMDAVRIKRTKFDKLVQSNSIKTIKKERKIYVPLQEISRYFEK